MQDGKRPSGRPGIAQLLFQRAQGGRRQQTRLRQSSQAIQRFEQRQGAASVVRMASRFGVGSGADRKEAQRRRNGGEPRAAAGEPANKLYRALALNQKTRWRAQQFPGQFERGGGFGLAGVAADRQAPLIVLWRFAPSSRQQVRARRFKRGRMERTPPFRQRGFGAPGEVTQGVGRPTGMALQVPIQQPVG